MSDLSKNNPFNTPKNYFEGFEEKLFEKLSSSESTLPEDDGFAIPKDYFDSFEGRLLDTLAEEKSKVIPLRSNYRNYYYIAASIAAILLIAIFIKLGVSDEPTFDDLANSEIDAYFENNDIGLTSYEIADVIPIDQLEVYDVMESRFVEEQMVDYLNENIEDIEALNLDYDE
ncbi:MAG: hypothetical protein CML05_14900 [Pseudozobellia sp.]|nr:hypothetical protein [Pseudozobellia sp.]|tara:strand:+ start:1650 stop:2165 length:516 start_codon:yes stop_codon:yes gene_type:complete